MMILIYSMKTFLVNLVVSVSRYLHVEFWCGKPVHGREKLSVDTNKTYEWLMSLT